ncbi:MAG TPA: ABC transporter substrate-binding protein [Burkholderiaceae bacterium]|jgi:NitT/TauT family transport system substrate-binding protein|nr:ABC transporter substrate-binding protein [Burkholderiaceae bacterium]
MRHIASRAARALFAPALIALAAASPAAAQEMDVKIGFYPGGTFMLPHFVAEAKGYYKDAGLTVTSIPVANGPLMNSQMGSGAIDFGYQPPSNVGLAREQGLDQVFIVGNVTMPWVLIARKDLKVPNAGKYPQVMNDLKGLNWGVYGRGSDGEVFMRVMAGDAKLNPDKDMTWIPVGGPPTGLPALKASRIDVYMTIAPAPTVAEALGYGQTIIDLRKGQGPGDFKGIHYNAVVTLRKTAQARPKAVAAIVAATVKAQCFLRKPENLPEIMKIAKAKLPVAELSEKDFEAMIRENLPAFTPTMPAAHFKTWNDMLLRANVLKQPVPPEETRWNTIPASEPAC